MLIAQPILDNSLGANCSCGLGEYRCSAVWAKQRALLPRSAIAVVPQNEDRPG